MSWKSDTYTVSQKGATLTMAITLSILDGFATVFNCCKVFALTQRLIIIALVIWTAYQIVG